MAEGYESHEFVPRDFDYFARTHPEDLFPSARPMELDLGSGDGGFLVAMAEAYPGRNFLGVERLLGRVRKTSRRARRLDLDNLRVLRLDVRYAVAWLLPRKAFRRIHLLFPDPWPKKKHARRRTVNPQFVAEVDQLLEPGGEFIFKTDHAGYFEDALEIIDASGLWEKTGPLPVDPFYAETDFERQWRAEGKVIHTVRYRSGSDASST